MIGDWVLINPWDNRKPFHPCKVVSISYNSYRGKDYTDWIDCDFWDEISPHDISPIPLTEKILEYNLATEPQISWCVGWNRKDDIHIEIKREDINAAFYGVITYVHQLQHALANCGIGKEIKLEGLL